MEWFELQTPLDSAVIQGNPNEARPMWEYTLSIDERGKMDARLNVEGVELQTW